LGAEIEVGIWRVNGEGKHCQELYEEDRDIQYKDYKRARETRPAERFGNQKGESESIG
jgi:hypothetical protein